MKTLVIIDPQNDFHDIPEDECPKGYAPSLPVKGATKDAERLIPHLKEYDRIFVTLDTHNEYHIGHPPYWVNAEGENPPPFTEIKYHDVFEGNWHPARARKGDALAYLEALESKGKTHRVWPLHCIEGSYGHKVYGPIAQELDRLILKGVEVHHIEKGRHPDTEAYGAFEAEVPLREAESTQYNEYLVSKIMEDSDCVDIAGQALSHCVGNSLVQMLKVADPRKLRLLINATSPVEGFEDQAEAFMKSFKEFGVTFSKCE